MITHVPMAVHPEVKNVLVIGAGDGGVIRELVRYPEISHIDMVEIDPLVVEVCRKYLPQTACRLDDPRLTIHYEDGLKFIRARENEYDLIIVDSTDPFGPGEGLFTREFYGNCYKALKEDGIMVNPVSYTHLDVYKRQIPSRTQCLMWPSRTTWPARWRADLAALIWDRMSSQGTSSSIIRSMACTCPMIFFRRR